MLRLIIILQIIDLAACQAGYSLNGENVDALSALLHVDNAYDFGRRICENLRSLFHVNNLMQYSKAIGSKIIARETVKAVRKDVTAKCYGGDIS